MTRLEETLARLGERTRGKGTDDQLLNEEGITVRLSDILILRDAYEHLKAELERLGG